MLNTDEHTDRDHPPRPPLAEVRRPTTDTQLSGKPSVKRLVAPFSIDALLADTSDVSAYMVFRDHEAEFSGLFSINDLDQLLSFKIFDEKHLAIARNGLPIDLFRDGKQADSIRARLSTAFRDGATLFFRNIDRHHHRLAQQKASWQEELRLPLHMHACLKTRASKNTQAEQLRTHAMILQIEGNESHHIRSAETEQPAASSLITLDAAPGSVLFLRGGVSYSATTTSDYSISLFIGIRTATASEIALKAFQKASLNEPIMRKNITTADLVDPKMIDEARKLILKTVREMSLEAARQEIEQALLREQIGYVSRPLLSIFGSPRVDEKNQLGSEERPSKP
jgi:hypothetical protein